MIRETVTSILQLIREIDPRTSVGKAKSRLAAVLGADRVELLDEQGRPVPDSATLNCLSLDSLAVDVFTHLSSSASPGTPKVQAGPATSGAAPPGAFDSTVEKFVREMANQESGREFVWIGHVAKKMLPEMGLNDREAAQFIERMETQGLICRAQYPNPNNPERPTTGLKLNRQHPVVRRCVQNGAVTRRVFPLGSARGEPVSETLIRERR